MLLARSHKAGPRIYPSPGASAFCSTCGAACVAKCGTVNAWHWAHKKRADCDPWSEGETPWHVWWKTRADENEIEVTVEQSAEPLGLVVRHRADIKRADGLVIELQHSNISATEIEEREQFYGNMVWLLDGQPFLDRFQLRAKDSYHTFRWYSPRRSWFAARRPILIDLGAHLFEVKKLHTETPCGGWGFLHPKKEGIRRLRLRALSSIEASEFGSINVEVVTDVTGVFRRTFLDLKAARRWATGAGGDARVRGEVRIDMFRADGSKVPHQEAADLWTKP
ncbi:MAG: hypothetical protein HOW73_20105 [Polyangiaceae bacterium]|nr:hypothetical protein [Polyangiaceae bacterium]